MKVILIFTVLVLVAAGGFLTVGLTTSEQIGLRAALGAGPSEVAAWMHETVEGRFDGPTTESSSGTSTTMVGRPDEPGPDSTAASADGATPPLGLVSTSTPGSRSSSNDQQPVASPNEVGPTSDADGGATAADSSSPGSSEGNGDGSDGGDAGETDSPNDTDAGNGLSGDDTPALVASNEPSKTPTATSATPAATAAVRSTPAPTQTATPSPTSTPAAPSFATPVPDPPAGDHAAAMALLADINGQRASAGLPPLQMDASLNQLAAEHAADMASQKKLSHSSSDGRDFGQRMRQGGVSGAAGENVAKGRGGVAGMPEVARAFMHSPVHRANILSESFTNCGIGVVTTDGDDWVAVIFKD